MDPKVHRKRPALRLQGFRSPPSRCGRPAEVPVFPSIRSRSLRADHHAGGRGMPLDEWDVASKADSTRVATFGFNPHAPWPAVLRRSGIFPP